MSPNKDDYHPYSEYTNDRGMYLSIGLHFLVIGLAIFGIPFLPKKDVEAMKVVTVELVPISTITNLPSSPQPAPPPKEEPKAPEPPKEEKKTPPPPPPPPAPTPEPPKPEVKEEKAPEEKAEQHPDVEKKKDEPKKKEEPKEIPKPPKPKVKPPEEKPKKKKEDELDFDSVLKTVEKIEKKQAKDEKKAEDAKPKSEAKAKSEAFYDPSKSLSMSEQDAIRQQISQYWSVPAGAKDAQNLQVELRISLLQDGTVRNVELVDQARYNSGDSFYRAAADSAMRAVLKAKQLKGLPPEKYDEWKDIRMAFDPKDMIY